MLFILARYYGSKHSKDLGAGDSALKSIRWSFGIYEWKKLHSGLFLSRRRVTLTRLGMICFWLLKEAYISLVKMTPLLLLVFHILSWIGPNQGQNTSHWAWHYWTPGLVSLFNRGHNFLNCQFKKLCALSHNLFRYFRQKMHNKYFCQAQVPTNHQVQPSFFYTSWFLYSNIYSLRKVFSRLYSCLVKC